MSSEQAPDRKQLVIVRHAKSSWDDPSLADYDRPLAPRGRKAVKRLRDHLDNLNLAVDIVLCSSSQRTRQTLDGIRPALLRHSEPRIDIEPDLYGAEADHLLARLRQIDDPVRCVVLIGHNPGVADLTGVLVAPDDVGADQPGNFPTAAVAALSHRGPWRELQQGSASLDSFWTPRQSR
jgi:phosphohistidine phosphatase